MLARAERALTEDAEPVRVCISVPPQHGKSQLLMHWLARLIGRHPDLSHAYCSYGARLAHKHARHVRRLAGLAGVELGDKQAQEEWTTSAGGGLVSTGIPGPLTGMPITGVAIIDDPLRGRQDASSPTYRERVWDWYTGDLHSRIHSRASIIVVATRWHVDDLTGRLTSGDYGEPFQIINLPAIDDEGRELQPRFGYGPKFDEVRRQNERDWWSLYMGSPRPEGGAVFERATVCSRSDLPEHGPTAIGIDLAYTAKTSSDYSAAVVLRQCEGAWWVMDVLRAQERQERFQVRLRALHESYGRPPMVWHVAAGPEAEVADRLRRDGLPLDVRVAGRGNDKLVRAMPAAVVWNRGDIVVPDDMPWSHGFISELESFTGVGDKHDDQVDALASAFSALPERRRSGDPGVYSRGRQLTAGISRHY